MIKRLCFFAMLLLMFSCASSPEDEPANEIESVALTLPEPSEVESNFSPYFGTISSDILLNIQKGSPLSIQNAMSALRNNYDDSNEQAKVLLAVCTLIMDYAWTSTAYIPTPNNTLPTNVYTSTLESIKSGIYESSYGTPDFFTLTLPSLVLFSNESIHEYYSDSKSALEASLGMDENSVLTLYLIGVLEMRMQNYIAAQTYLEKAMVLDSRNMDIIYAYFELLLEADLIENANTLGQDLMTQYPSDVKILEYSAMAAYEAKDYTAAESLVAQALRFTPDNTSLLLFRAKVLFELGDFLDVSSLLDVYSRTRSQDREYLLLRARLQSAWNKNIPAATRTIQEALTLYPDDVNILLFAATLASTNGESILGQTAVDFLAIILQDDPDNFEALSILVKESIVSQNWQEAYEASGYVLSNGDTSLEAALLHVEICIALGFLQEARETIIPYYTPESVDENLHQWYIRLLIAEGRYSDALNLIEDVLQSATGRMKSVLYFERSRLQSTDTRILSDLRASLTANPRNEFALYGLYTYYYDRQDYSKAQYYLKQVIALSPANSDAIARNAELDTLLR